jgi:hypothetical protein
MTENEQLVQFARGVMDRIVARLRAGVVRTPRLDAALARAEAATAKLVSWVPTAPIHKLGDSLSTPIGSWVRAVHALQTALDPEDDDEPRAAIEGEYVSLRDSPLDTPFEEWMAGIEALLAELDRKPDTTT